jgi:hypothetical protein
MNLITVATFSNAIDAHIIMGKLESEGIQCFLKDEHTVTANPMYEIAYGGIKLQVPEKDVEAAKEILKETSYNNKEAAPSLHMYNIIKANTPLKILLAIIIGLLLFLF